MSPYIEPLANCKADFGGDGNPEYNSFGGNGGNAKTPTAPYLFAVGVGEDWGAALLVSGPLDDVEGQVLRVLFPGFVERR